MLGGMLTAQGVSAIDGNHHLPSGLWYEFREKLRSHYGGTKALATGWVSNTLFEPHVADSIFKSMAGAEPLLEVFHGYHLVEIFKSGVDLLQLGVTAMGGGAVLMGMLNIFESLSSDNPGPRAQGMRQAFGGGVIVLIGTTLVPMLKTMLG